MDPARGGFGMPFFPAAVSGLSLVAALCSAKGDIGMAGSFTCRGSIKLKHLQILSAILYEESLPCYFSPKPVQVAIWL